MKFASVPMWLAVLGLAACASSPPKPTQGSAAAVASADNAPKVAAEQQRLRDILVSKSKASEQRLAELQAAIAAPAFNSLAVEDQFQALTLALGAMRADQAMPARGYLDRAIALPGIEFEDQLTALRMAVNMKYAAAADKSLTLLAQQWPDRVAGVDSRLILRALALTDHVARRDMLAALQALYAAHWKVEWDIEPSAYWRNLVELFLEENSLPQAIDVSGHITEPYVLIAMRADRRFDAVVAARPEQFDVQAAAERQLKHLQSLSDDHPKSLELKTRVMDALRSQQHYEAMLAVADSAMEEIKATNFPERLYDDYEEKHAAFFRSRSIALQRVGQWDEAVDQSIEAARDGSIEQLIGLADLYCSLNRPKDALAVITPVGPARTSAYGAMQVEAIRLQAALESGDHAQVARSLAYLSAHRTDSPDAYLFALVVAKQMKQAAEYLVSQLQDKDLRQTVLLEAQIYLPTPGTPEDEAVEAQWRSVLARKDVHEALDQVGRIQSYRLESP